MAPSGRRGGASGSSAGSAGASGSAGAPASRSFHGNRSLPAILARKRKSDFDSSSQDSWVSTTSSLSSSGSSADSFCCSASTLSSSPENDSAFAPDGAAMSENQPPPAHSAGTSSQEASVLHPAAGPSGRVPLSALQQQQQPSAKASLSASNSRRQSSVLAPKSATQQKQQQLIKALPKLRMDEKSSSSDSHPSSSSSSGVVPPAAKKLKLRQSWSQFREFIRSTSLGGNGGGGRGGEGGGAGGSGVVNPRGCGPLPCLSFADRQEMWDLICKKEYGMYRRKTGAEVLERHPALQPRMRAILMDWIIEVCEVYRLHRETFYLAVDFIDRYLTSTRNVPKNRLQLIGVTSLFIGAKIEEIYPPKLQEFAYVTDGACSEEEILTMELVILKELNWGLSPMTPNAWMKLYMQASTVSELNSAASAEGAGAEEVEAAVKDDAGFVTPKFSGLLYARVMQILDLAVLDIQSLCFRYSVLAAAALSITHGRDMATAVSGYRWEGELQRCATWLAPFAATLDEERHRPSMRSLHNVAAENQHNVQTHSVDLSALDRAQERQVAASRSSPDLSSNPVILSVGVTPPDAEGDVHFKKAQQQQQLPNTPSTTSSTSSSSPDRPSVFLSPETPTSAPHHHHFLHRAGNAR